MNILTAEELRQVSDEALLILTTRVEAENMRRDKEERKKDWEEFCTALLKYLRKYNGIKIDEEEISSITIYDDNCDLSCFGQIIIDYN